MEQFTSDIVLEAAIDDAGNFDADAMLDALNAAGLDASGLDYTDVYALAAAIEYYGAGITDALAVIKDGDFKFFCGVDTYTELGNALVAEAVPYYLPDIIMDYLDTEAIGEDYERDTQGQFTRFGFFAPVNN